MAYQRSEWMDPVSTVYRWYQFIQMSPNGQGLIVLMTLPDFEGYDIGGIFWNDLAAGAAPDFGST